MYSTIRTKKEYHEILAKLFVLTATAGLYLMLFVIFNENMHFSTLLAETFPLCFPALYCHSLCGFGCSRFVLVVSVPRKRPLQTAVWDSC